jgi:hypothetical protein
MPDRFERHGMDQEAERESIDRCPREERELRITESHSSKRPPEGIERAGPRPRDIATDAGDLPVGVAATAPDSLTVTRGDLIEDDPYPLPQR